MPALTYQEALDYLYSFVDTERRMPRRPADLNLPRTAALLDALGQPQRALRCVVVAGTKGKGSTSALLEAMARAAGLRVGLWSSPHLHSYRERIQVDRELIAQDELVAQVEAIQPTVESFDQDAYGAPSVFELGFAIALRHFAARAVDLAILEVGLGGRYDSANVITPLLSVVTSISYDHMAILGDTLEQIASEKAGIFKPGVPAITIPQMPAAFDTIARVAGDVGAPLWVAEAAGLRDTATGALRAYPLASPQEIVPGQLQGTFQRENARLATGAALLLGAAGLPIGAAAIARGLAEAQWPGRLETVPGEPPIVLDGAHNGDSAQKLVASLRELFPARRIVLVLGTSQDKDIARILDALAPAVSALVLTHSRHPRAWVDLDGLAELARPRLPGPQTPIQQAPDVPEALAQARALAAPGDLICVTGSLFVVAAAREALGLGNETD